MKDAHQDRREAVDARKNTARLEHTESFAKELDLQLESGAGEVIADPTINEATQALEAGAGEADTSDPDAVFEANKEPWTLHELIGHRLVQSLLGQHRGRTFVDLKSGGAER